MKLKIKILQHNTNIDFPSIIDKGEWVDLRAAETLSFKAPYNSYKNRITTFDNKQVSLGISVKLPKGFEAVILPRSSTFNKYGLLLCNSQGVVDNSYSGQNDIWQCNVLATRETTISEGNRICQFRIQLSQKATVWQKLKWLFSNGINIIKVPQLEDENRGGWGSTGN